MLIESLTNAKNQLSRLVERARRGERIRILVHGVPAADLVPVTNNDDTNTSGPLELAELERQGVVHRGDRSSLAFLQAPGPSPRGSTLSVLLQDERDER